MLGAGLGAGLVNLVLGFAFAHLMGIEKFQAILTQHGLRAIGQPSDAIPRTIVRVMLGLLVTTLFACLAPRFGGGPRTAIAAGLFAWAFVYAYTAWQHAHLGLYGPSWAWRLAAWRLFEMIATAFAGG